MTPHCGSSCHRLADLTRRGAPLPTTLQELAGCHPPPGLESCGEKVWEGETTGRTGRGWRRSAILCKSASQSLPLSQKPSLHSPVRCSCIPSSSAPLPVLPDRHRSLGPVQGKAFQPSSPLPSPLVHESAPRPSKLRTGCTRRAGYHSSARGSDPSPRPCHIPWDNTRDPAACQSPKEPTQCYNKVQLPWL